MNTFYKKIISIIGAFLIASVSFVFPKEQSYAKEQVISLTSSKYEFNEKSEYEIKSTSPDSSISYTLGTIDINGDITDTSTKDGVPAYTIADNSVFNIYFTYDDTLKNASEEDWHIANDSKLTIDGTDLDDNIKNGAVILQTSLDGKKWSTNCEYTNVEGDLVFDEEQINSVQLSNGCYYRIIVAFKTEKTEKGNFDVSNLKDTKLKKNEYKKYSEVYKFYASYKNTDTTISGKKFYFDVGCKNSKYTSKTKTNTYTGSETIDKKDPHYGWDLGKFCLSGYTDTGKSEDIYLKTVGDKIKLTFNLSQDIECLNGNEQLCIARDKKGSDEEFKIPAHDMKHGELIIRHTDSENKSTEVKYSDFLSALASPGADTSVQLFEEGDYEVHLNYGVTTKGLIDSTSYYQTKFNFKIRNGNCMVYIFDAESGAELANGDTAPNGFSIDTAKSSYPKLHVKKEVLNTTSSGLVEDTRINSATTDGEIFTDEGIYTITAYNRYDEQLPPAIKTIYVGTDNILAAYTANLDSPNPYSIDQLNNMVEQGYEIKSNGDIIAPNVSTTATEEKIAEKSEETTADSPVVSEQAAVDFQVTEQVIKNSSSPLPYIGAGAGGAAVVGAIIGVAIKKKKS